MELKQANNKDSPFSAKGTLQKYHRTSLPSDGLLVWARYFCLPWHCSITSSNLAMFEGVFFNKSGEVSFTAGVPDSPERASIWAKQNKSSKLGLQDRNPNQIIRTTTKKVWFRILTKPYREKSRFHSYREQAIFNNLVRITTQREAKRRRFAIGINRNKTQNLEKFCLMESQIAREEKKKEEEKKSFEKKEKSDSWENRILKVLVLLKEYSRDQKLD